MQLETTAELLRRYPFTVKIHHRETLGSFGRRLTAANFDSDSQLRFLVREAKKLDRSKHFSLETIASAKSGVDETVFERAQANGLFHVGGGQCEHCTVGLGERWLCTRCSHGEEIRQYPHLDGDICLRHQRWTAPGVTPGEQRSVSSEQIHADVRLRKLRRRGHVDARLVADVRAMLRAQPWPESMGDADKDFESFTDLEALLSLLNNADFQRQVLKPALPFAEGFEALRRSVVATIPQSHELITRKLWMFLRPVVLSVRSALYGRRPYSPGWVHDLVIRPSVAEQFQLPAARLEPMADYLQVIDEGLIPAEDWEALAFHHSPVEGVRRESLLWL